VSPNGKQAYSFKVKWDGRFVAEVAKMSPLRRTTEVVVYRDGGSPNVPRRSPGRTSFDSVTLERGLIVDAEFERWANKVFNLRSGPGTEVSLKDFRKDVRVELSDASGAMVRAYQLFRCWVSEYRALSEVSAGGATLVELIRLENEGWERDFSIVAPSRSR
jgi:phage tail-like protein